MHPETQRLVGCPGQKMDSDDSRTRGRGTGLVPRTASRSRFIIQVKKKTNRGTGR